MRRLVFLLVSLSFLIPTTVYNSGYLGMEEKMPWNFESKKALIEIKTKFHPVKKLTYKLEWVSHLKNLLTALKKGDLELAEELQHEGYTYYLAWLEDRNAVTYYYHHLMVRNL